MKSVFTIIFATTVFLLTRPVYGGLIFTLSDPVVASGPSGVPTSVETFDSRTVGKIRSSFDTDFGTYRVTRGNVRINSANQWGGAGGDGNYLFIPGGGELELTLTRPAGYFGFWWSAGDGGNRLSVDTLSQTVEFTTSDILASSALTSGHFGNPFWQNPSSAADFHAWWEPFAFVNLFAETSADAIRSIRFYGRNFESDNHTVLPTVLPSSGTFISKVGAQPVSEPGTLALLIVALLFSFKRMTGFKSR